LEVRPPYKGKNCQVEAPSGRTSFLYELKGIIFEAGVAGTGFILAEGIEKLHFGGAALG